tara:strand:+ start:2750 stop:3370 length:621 start_codon:yes stop_codon:yes gene_type:complete
MHNIKVRLDTIRELNVLTESKARKLSVKDLVEGSFLELDKNVFKVQSVSRYLDVKWSSFAPRKNNYVITELELFSINSGEKGYLEWEEDDELEIYLTTDLVKLRDISVSGKILTTSLLEDIAEEEEGVVSFNGVSYEYSEEDTWAGRFSKSGDLKDGIPMRAYEFESNDGKSLTIETWHEDSDEKPDREAFLSKQIKPSAIKILAS